MSVLRGNPVVVLADGGDERAACALATRIGQQVVRVGSAGSDNLGSDGLHSNKPDLAGLGLYKFNPDKPGSNNFDSSIHSQSAFSLDKLDPDNLVICFDDRGCFLAANSMQLRADFSRMRHRITSGRVAHELLVRAVKIKGASEPLHVVDATAGLGEDSLVLAAAGYTVDLFEHNPVIAAMLASACTCGSQDPELASAISRMRIHERDGVEALMSREFAPDVVLLDPMFPAREKSARVKKKLQLLQQLESPCSNEREMLDAALSSGAHKVVVKRPPKGPYLAGVKPAYSLESKAVRFDCYVVA